MRSKWLLAVLPAALCASEGLPFRQSEFAAGIYEKEGDAVYNSAVLVGRAGNFVGK